MHVTLVHLLETLFETFLNTAHTLYMYLLLNDICILQHFTSHSTSTLSMFKVITINMLYKLPTYLLSYTAQ